MGHVSFAGADENLVTHQYSAAKGPVLRSEKCELARVFFAEGTGADWHQHPEEQTFYCLEGELECWVGDDNYTVVAGEASWHPSNVPHRVHAHKDTYLISFKTREMAQIYEATGELR